MGLIKLERNNFGVLVNFSSKRSCVLKEKMIEFRPNDIPRCVVVTQIDKVCVYRVAYRSSSDPKIKRWELTSFLFILIELDRGSRLRTFKGRPTGK
jgi:hypothetical protein